MHRLSCASTLWNSKCKQTQTQNPKMFSFVSNQCNRSSFVYFNIDCFGIFIRVANLYFLKLIWFMLLSCVWIIYWVVLGSYTRLFLGHILGCAWIIIHLLGAFWDAEQMIFKKNFFSIFPKHKNVFKSVRIRWWHMFTTHLSFSKRAHKQ